MSKIGDRFEEKLLEGIEGVFSDEDSVEEMTQGIKDNVDLSAIIGELCNEDDEIKVVLKSKVRALLKEKISTFKSLDEFYDDDDDMWSAIREGSNVAEVVDGLLGEGGELHDGLKDKIKDLAKGKIDAIESLEEFYDDEDDMWSVIRESAKINDVIEKLFEENKELQDKLKDKIGELVVEKIDNNLDEGDLPDWDDFAELLKIEDLIKSILDQKDDVRKLLVDKLKEIIEEHIDNNIDDDDLPKNINEILGMTDGIETILQDPDFRQTVNSGLRKKIQEMILRLVSDNGDNLNLKDKVCEHAGVKRIIERQLDDLMMDAQFATQLKESTKKKLLENKDLSNSLANMLFEGLAKNMVDKIFSKI